MKLRTRMMVVPLVAGMFVTITGLQAMAVHDLGVFELDGNIADNAAAGDDWVTLHAGGGGAGLLEFTHVVDGDSPVDTSYLHQGGSKDVNDISEWLLTSNDEAPDKDEIINAFAAAYQNNGDLLVFFGADRFSNDGDAQVGFWFVQDDVSVGGGSITGQHTIGDVLVLSDFVNGGTVSEVRVFEWVGGKNPLNEITPPSAADCATAPAGDDACALVNNAILTGLPWAFTPKGNVGASQTYPVGTFYEGGVNLTALGVATDCFSTFIAETRTSQALDARLKDIAVGDFDTCATKSGKKFEDLNGDGDRDAGEPGLSGWEIHLFGTEDTGGSVHLHETTDANGNYEFGNLEPGEYTVCETQQSGWHQSMPGTGTGTTSCSGHTHNGTTPGARGYAIDLAFGDSHVDNDFGNYRMATKTGMKFHDLDGDGVKDAGEPGLEGWTITLNGTSGSGGAVSMQTSTNASGVYSFNVPPGSYTVCEQLTAGWTQSFPASGASCPGGTVGYDISLTSNEVDSGNDFGNFRNATKSGVKFHDLNGDGVKQGSEPLLSGWDIHLRGTDNRGNAVSLDTSTNGSGAYSFSVPPGDYVVCESLKDGWTQSMPGALGSGITTCTAGDGLGYDISLDSGEIDSGNDFGNFQLAKKSGTKYEDANANGDRDAGEPGIPGWTIYLVDQATGGQGVFQTAVTDANGAYEFDVPPGAYVICEASADGWMQSEPAAGSACSSLDVGDSLEDHGYVETFQSGDISADNDFGNFRAATKSGTKFHDLNANGVRDAGEPGLPDWTITLSGTDGMGNAVDLQTTTDANGDYSFTIKPGDYLVCEVIPDRWMQSHPASGPSCDTGVGYDISLDSGEVDAGNDFGNFRNAVKTGHKFDDLNANSVWDAGEPGLQGWTIILDGVDGQGNAVHLEQQTDADGRYRFVVPPGSYTVCEVQQSGWSQSFPTSGHDCGDTIGYAIQLESQETDSHNDFGNFRGATKSGTKFEDLNANGARDAGEPGLPGWTIHLVGTSGDGASVNLTDVTDGSGNYAFHVPPGEYVVCESLEPGWTQSMPGSEGGGIVQCATGDGLGYDITLASGETDSGNDFGNFRLARKSGVKYHDLNANGDRDAGEPGLPGWIIHIVDADTHGAVVHQTAMTAADGGYEFEVEPGSYLICEQSVADWVQSEPGSGRVCAGLDVGVALEDDGYAETFQSGDISTDNDFGNFQNARKTGTKFHDLNANGVRDAGEPGLADWTITLVGTDGLGKTVDKSTTTNANGNYSFSFKPGTYVVCEVIPAGWIQSHPAQGAPCPTGVGYEISLISGEVDSGNDFGNFQNASKSGTKFHDLNANGVQDDGEPGLPDWTITLVGTAGSGDAVDLQTQTDANGDYSFEVPPGEYLVCEVIPDGWSQSHPAAGAACETGVGYDISLDSGEADTGNDFGNFQASGKEGTKFNDLDGDGVRDAGEPGLADWQIRLVGQTGGGIAIDLTTLTDANGDYSFVVPPGNYLVCETQQGDASVTPAISVDKTADPPSGSPGDAVTYTYVIANTGPVALSNVVAIDDVLGPVGDPIASLPVGASVTRTLSSTLPAEAGLLTNTVDVTADADWLQTFPVEGADCSGNGGGVGYAITLTSNLVETGNDFGNTQRTVAASDTESVTVVLPSIIVRTGTDSRLFFDLSIMLLGAGVAMVAIARRRERRMTDEDELF